MWISKANFEQLAEATRTWSYLLLPLPPEGGEGGVRGA
jgi:hypothetical protein